METAADVRDRGEIHIPQRCVLDLTHARDHAPAQQQCRLCAMRKTAVAISRARARASAHREIAADLLEQREIQVFQLCVNDLPSHAWPRTSLAAGQARFNRTRARARTHKEITDGLKLGEIQGGQRCVVPNLTHAWSRARSAAAAAGEARRDARGCGRDQPSEGWDGRGRARTMRSLISVQSVQGWTFASVIVTSSHSLRRSSWR